MRKLTIAVVGMAMLLGLSGDVARGQGTVSPPPPPKDKASYFSHTDLDKVWKDLETRQVNNTRIVDGGGHQINVRIVTPESLPLVHKTSGDIWVVQEGTATAITGGTIPDAKLRGNSGDDYAGKAIVGGTEQALKAGDVLYVPPGVPHGFKDLKGFRAFLIRWGT